MNPAFDINLGTVSRFQALVEVYLRQLIWTGVTATVETFVVCEPNDKRTPSSLLFRTAGNLQRRAGGAR